MLLSVTRRLPDVTDLISKESIMLTKDLQPCIENCTQCHQICLRQVSRCLGKSGDHARPEHIRLLRDCAEICQTSANFMLRYSPLHPLTCGVCAEICEQCAQECSNMSDGDFMQECIEMCRRCAASCKEMSSSERL